MKIEFRFIGPLSGAIAAAMTMIVAGAGLHAQQDASVAISVKGHRFQPAEVHAPANQPLTIQGHQPRLDPDGISVSH
jgi:hypothetical protein